MSKTNIPYADVTWSPITGCSKVSPGCANCWAATLSQRWRWTTKPWTPANAAENVVLRPDRLDEPLHWRKPRTVAVCFMSDLFHEDVPLHFLRQVWSVIIRTPQHRYLLLTKRPERMVWALGPKGIEFYAADGPVPCPQPNVWLGVSVENQRWADIRIPLLLDTPAAHRWASLEPLLGPVDLGRWLDREGSSPECANCHRTKAPIGRSVPVGMSGSICDRECQGYNNDPKPDQLWLGETAREFGYTNEPFIDWIVVGGESGPSHCSMELAWADRISEQCHAAGVPYFGKQIAARLPDQPLPGDLGRRETPW